MESNRNRYLHLQDNGTSFSVSDTYVHVTMAVIRIRVEHSATRCCVDGRRPVILRWLKIDDGVRMRQKNCTV